MDGKALSLGATQFFASSVVLALERLHTEGVLCRSIAAESMCLDQKGYLQLVDLRFAKYVLALANNHRCTPLSKALPYSLNAPLARSPIAAKHYKQRGSERG